MSEIDNREAFMPAIPERVFRPEWHGRPLLTRYFQFAFVLALVSWLFAHSPALFGWTGGQTAPGSSILSAPAFGAIVSGVGVWSWRRKMMLAIVPTGLRYDMPGNGVDVAWEEVAGTAEWRGRWPWQHGDGLLLHKVRWEMLNAQARIPADEALQGRVIPLDVFDPRWRQGAIGDEIRRYVPPTPARRQRMRPMSVQADQAVAAPHVYRPRATPAAILAGLALAVLSVLIYGVVDHFVSHTPMHKSLISAVIWAAFFWPFMIWISWGGISLTIYSDAFIYRTSGLTIQAHWRDVERIDRGRWPLLWWGDRLVLRRDSRPRPWWGWSYGARWRIVPLSIFDSHWREGPLGYDLRYFAQHLFDAGVPR